MSQRKQEEVEMRSIDAYQSKITTDVNQKKRDKEPRDNISIYKHTLSLIVFGFFLSPSISMADESILSKNYEFASLSALVYDKSLSKGDQFYLDGKSATVIKVDTKSDDFGFSAIAVEVEGEIVVAFRGTELDTLEDLRTDFGLPFVSSYRTTRQYNATLRFVNELTSEVPVSVLTFTGHSLGGSLAQYAGVIYEGKAITFNAAPISKNAFNFFNIDGAELTRRGENILNIRQKGDPISDYLLGEHLNLGSNVVVDSGLCASIACYHSMSYLVSAALNERINNSSLEAGIASDLENNTENPTEPDLCDSFDCNGKPKEALPEQLTSNPMQDDIQRIGLENERFEQQRQAELDRQEAARLEPERQAQQRRIALANERKALVQKQDGVSNQLTDAKARLQEARNQLAVSQFNDLEIVDRDLNRIRTELATLSRRAGDQTQQRSLQSERSVLIDGAEIVRQLYQGRIDASTLTRAQRDSLTRMGQALGYTAAGGKPIWQTVAENARFTAQRIVGRVSAIDSELSRLSPLSPSEQRRLDEIRNTERRLTSDKTKILATIDRAEQDIKRYQGTILSLESQFSQNEQRLTQLGYDIENYVPPTFQTGPQTDWANYESRYTPLDEQAADTSDKNNVAAIEIASSSNPNNSSGTTTLPGGPPVTGPTTPNPTNPVTPPAEPTVALRGSFSYTGADGRATASQTNWTGGFVGPLSKGADGGKLLSFHLGSYGIVGNAGIVSKAKDQNALFSDNLSWGRWSGSYFPGGPGACSGDGQYCGIQNFTDGLWIAGIPSTSSQFALKSGTATYNGDFFGDFDNGTSIEKGKVSGKFQLGVDFASRTLSGNADFSIDNGRSIWDSASITGNLDSTREDPMLWATLTSTGPGLSFGGSGSMSARFYGSDASEIAGAFRYSGQGGVASGIWGGYSGGVPVNGNQWRGFLAAKVTGQSALFTRGITSVEGVNNPAPGVPKTGFVEVKTSSLAPSIITHVSEDGYSFTSWGAWSGSGVSISNSPIDQAKIVIGQVTPPLDMPSSGTRNFGGASHNSQIAGIGFNGEQIAGTISLGADFSNGHIGGQFNFTADGNQWVNGTISNSPIQGSNFNGNGSNMNINQGGSGNLNGTFFGYSAQEVAGEWAIWGVPGAVAGADGVFRAKQ